MEAKTSKKRNSASCEFIIKAYDSELLSAKTYEDPDFEPAVIQKRSYKETLLDFLKF